MARVLTWEEAHTRTFWFYGLWAGVIAGVVFMMMQMLLVWWVQGTSPWAPPRMVAGIVLGEDVVPPPAGFEGGVIVMAMIVHFALSIVYGLIGAWIVHRFDWGMALLLGAVYGFAIYILNFYIVASFVFTWFAEARSWISLLDHVVFGMVIGGVYVTLRNRHVQEPRRT